MYVVYRPSCSVLTGSPSAWHRARSTPAGRRTSSSESTMTGVRLGVREADHVAGMISNCEITAQGKAGIVLYTWNTSPVRHDVVLHQ